jgi:hypothetical protein
MRDERVLLREARVDVDERGAVHFLLVEGVDLLLLVEELARRAVERERDVTARRVARLLDGLEDHGERGLVALEARREAAFVADGHREAALLEDRLEVVEHLGAHAQALAEARRAVRHDHELLDLEAVVGVGAAVEDVHERRREHARLRAAEVAVERQAHGLRGRARDAIDTPRIAFAPRLLLVLVPSRSSIAWSIAA